MAVVTRAGGGATVALTWRALTNLNTGVSLLGGGFFPTCDCALDGTMLLFRGGLVLPTDSGGTFRVCDLPAAIARPAFIRRLFPECGSTGTVPLNFNTDGTVTLSVTNPSNFIIMDGMSIPGWT